MKKIFKQHVDKKLLMRLRIFLLISFIMLLIIIYDISQNIISIELAVSGLVAGLIIGLVAGRIFNILWHEEKQQVASRLDMFGIAILIIYIISSFSRNWLLEHWVHGPALTALTFALLGGLMFGRFLSMRFRIYKILRDSGVFGLHLKTK